MTSATDFLRSIDHSKLTSLDRACALLWWIGRDNDIDGLETAEICEIIEKAGHPKQNVSRLDRQLADDKRVARVPGTKGWRLHPRGREEFDRTFADRAPRLPKASDSVLSRELFSGTRGYIEKVVRQVNASYDVGLYDCCAVMCRRLLETLIIEVYEHVGRANHVKTKDGYFLMLADLIKAITNDVSFNLSRNAKKELEEFKRLGDLSAHNRRFNAQRSDIDHIKSGLRISTEELLHLARLI